MIYQKSREFANFFFLQPMLTYWIYSIFLFYFPLITVRNNLIVVQAKVSNKQDVSG